MISVPFLGAAIVTITLALVFYSIGVWGEKIQGTLKAWHLVFFFLGLVADTVGTGIMNHIASTSGNFDVLHAATGMVALILMAIHAIWAAWTLWKGSERDRQHFSRFSIIVWFFWLIPYFIGVYLGATH